MKFKQYAAICKVEDNDDGTVTVEGVASDGSVDLAGEIVDPGAMKAALPDFMRLGTGALREMHQPMAAGKVISAEINDAGETIIRALVVDPVAVLKVRQEVYKGFSIGGKCTLRDGSVIKGLRLTEISLVDSPCNTNSVIQMWKADSIEDDMSTTAEEELAEMITKGEISHEDLLAIAKAKKSGDADGKDKTKPDGDESASTTDQDNASTENTGDADSGTDDKGKDGKKKGGDAEKAAAPSDVEKGMHSVSDFASILQSLSWIVSDAEWEKQYEGDDSPIPEQLRTWLAGGVKIFTGMAAEESAEMVAGLQAMVPADAQDVALAAKAGDVSKAGAKFSNDTKAVLDKVSEALTGAIADIESLNHNGDDSQDDASKAAPTADVSKSAPTDIEKLSASFEKLASDNTALAKRNEELATSLDVLQKRFDTMPRPSKGVAMAIGKGEDLNGSVSAPEVKPVMKADGTVDEFATSIKKAQQESTFQVFR